MAHQLPVNLPIPDEAARQISEALQQRITGRIEAAGGWLSFEDYMEAVLYEPGLGYYSAGAQKFGSGGDFVTAPEISAVFSRCLAGQVAAVLDSSPQGVVLELGAGSGAMAADMLAEFEALDAMPAKYLILEPSADLRERQEVLISQRVPHLLNKVEWLDELPDRRIKGVIVANEVVDALPLRLFAETPQGLMETGVVHGPDGFAFSDKPADFTLHALISRLSAQVGGRENWPDTFRSEIRTSLDDWFAAVADSLEYGAMIFVDYGAVRREFYRGERANGTLQCFFRHRVHDDPFWYPGLQDITGWVDFTQLAENAVAAGLQVAGFSTQAQFLLNAGVDQQVNLAGAATPEEQAKLAAAVRKLMLPGEMGEVFKAMLFTTAGVETPPGFGGRDLRTSL